jgi:hypothetical protein
VDTYESSEGFRGRHHLSVILESPYFFRRIPVNKVFVLPISLIVLRSPGL